MPNIIPISELSDEQIRHLQKQAKTKRDFQKVQIIALKRLTCPHNVIKASLNVCRDTITRTISRYYREGSDSLFADGRGGRKHEHMTEKEEATFLQPFLKKAAKGGMLIVHEIHMAYGKILGKEVPFSTVYAMLHRNGWRKISPRPKHPKGDEEKQQAFKAIFPLRGTKNRPQGQDGTEKVHPHVPR